MFVRLCNYVYTCTFMCVHIYAHVCLQPGQPKHVHMYLVGYPSEVGDSDALDDRASARAGLKIAGTSLPVCLCACVCMRGYLCMNVYVYVYECVCVCVCECVFACIGVCMCACVCSWCPTAPSGVCMSTSLLLPCEIC